MLLNNDQARGLANFFFDIAKGLILGSLGLSLAVPLAVKVAIVIPSIFFALWCVKMALYLLEDIK